MKINRIVNRWFIGCFFTAVSFLLLIGCQAGSSISSAEVVYAFQDAGLEAQNQRAMTKDDYGIAPYVGEGTRFFLPSLCPDCGGRVIVTDNAEDADKIEAYYVTLGEESAAFFSWVFRNGNVVVQINGDLPEAEARRYEAILMGLDI